MVTRMESFAKNDEERRLEGVVRTMEPEQREKYLEKEATKYLNMAFRYSSNRRLLEKRE